MLNPITTGLPKSCRCLRGFSESSYERRPKGCRLDGLLPSPGEAVFTATVTSTSGAPPDGETVTFKRGTTVLGTGTLSGGSASFSDSMLTVGTKSITAVYAGDSNFARSTSKAILQIIRKTTSTTSLTSSLNPSIFGQSVTFTATVAPQFSGTPTGTVTFYDGTTTLKAVGVSGEVAKFTL